MGVTVFLSDCENCLVLVKIYEAPNELQETTLIGRLSHYCRVFSFRRDKIAQFIDSGVRTVRMTIHSHIPNIINVEGEIVRIWYPSQLKTCRNCGLPDHLVKDCSSTRCFNCKHPGHRVDECSEARKCTVCLAEDQQLIDCHFVIQSANVDNTIRGKDGESSDGSDKGETEIDKKKQDEQRKERARQKQEEFEKQRPHMQMQRDKKQEQQQTQVTEKERQGEKAPERKDPQQNKKLQEKERDWDRDSKSDRDCDRESERER